MSALTQSADQYLALRRSLGFKLGRPGQLVTQFASYCSATGSDLVTTELALAWARLPATRRRDLRLAAVDIRKRPDVNFEGGRTVGLVRQPQAVG